MHAKTTRGRIGADIFDSCMKVLIVRDPFDCALSRYRFTLKRNRMDSQRMSFGRFLIDMPERLVENRRIAEIDGISTENHMMRFEDFENGIRQLPEEQSLEKDLWSPFREVNAKASGRNPQVDMNLYRNTPEAVSLIKSYAEKY